MTDEREPTSARRTYGVNRPASKEPALSGAWGEYIYLRAGTTIVRLPDGVDPLAAMSPACAQDAMDRLAGGRVLKAVGET
ncbi:hypothetical protein ABZ801_39850 [Actinomadura sp. NPDC047616]|uniref:hypothetical protein n=1 Tax=Actinomadura sp. NPDC047616 TaxID=3155914 RepID=UPI00340B8480